MNFAHSVGFQALSFVDRTVPKKVVIFVGEMNVQGVTLHKTHKLSHSHPQLLRSMLGTPEFLHHCFPVFRNINLRRSGSFGMLTKFQGKLASLQQVSSLNSQDNFHICCADMYLVRFLANFPGFRVFL